MHLGFKVISIIVSIIVVASAAGVFIYRNYEKETTGKIDFYIASDEVPNVTGIYLTLSMIGVYNGVTWSNHSINKKTDLYLDNFSSPGLIDEINLPSHNYSYFTLYIVSAYIGVSGSYHKLSLTSNHTLNSFDLNLAGGTTVSLLFGFKIEGNLNISERTLTPVTTLTKQ